MTDRLRVHHIITGLGVGGAETALYRLLDRHETAGIRSRVTSLTRHGTIGDRIRDLGVPVRSLDLDWSPSGVGALPQLLQDLRRRPTDLVQTWMYHADLVGGLASALAGRIPTIWGIRQSDLSPERNDRRTLWTARTCASLSNLLPERIVCNSHAGRKAHKEFGYAADRMAVIPNGFDLDVFQPDAEARTWLRDELGIAADVPVIGTVSRFDPQKDPRCFVRAASRLVDRGLEAGFVMCGTGLTPGNDVLVRWLEENGVRDRFHLLGPRDDVPRLLPGLDLFSLSSQGEGTPNALGEAMACETPCVVTDVGDCARLLGDTGQVVPPGDPEALSQAWDDLLSLDRSDREDLGRRARRRIRENYSLDKMARRYAELYQEVLRCVG